MFQIQNELNLDGLLKWLCTTPKITTYRVNTLTHTVDQVYDLLKSKVSINLLDFKYMSCFYFSCIEIFKDLHLSYFKNNSKR